MNIGMGGHQPGGGQGGKTGFTALFIRRPIFALVVNTLIVVAGLAAWNGVEIRELPQVDQPVVSVTTEFDGASPETIDREVTSVIEGAVSRVQGIKGISSSSSFGRSRVTLEFSDTTDIGQAANDVRDALGRITGQLPDDADEPRIVKADSDSQPIMRLALTSDTMSMDDMTLLVENEISDRLAAVEGVADVTVYGDQEKIFRIDLNQAKLAGRGVTVANLREALSDASYDVPAGSLTSASQDISVRATADLKTPEQFENLMLGNNVRLRDVATVTLGPDTGTSALRSNGREGIGLGIIRQAQSNTVDISEGVRSVVDAISSDILPTGTELKITSDDAVFINGAIHEVEIALFVAVFIVTLVIYLFLLDWRATLIPTITMPIALIGTVAAIYLAGFSINILTLLAIVLATGLVVDDAIVVLENIVRRRAEGLGPRAAAVHGTLEVFFAVLATTATLAAVFVPLSFLPGQTGGLFREFGFVLAFSILLSSFVSLTLCPMLASRMLTKEPHEHDGVMQRFGRRASAFYRVTLRACLNAPLIVFAVAAFFTAAGALGFLTLKSELTPNEDRSQVMLRINAPQGVSLEYTQAQLRRIEEGLQPLLKSGEISNVFSISGQGGSANSGFMVLTLAPWEERERTQGQIVADINRATSKIPSVRAFTIQANSLGIRGAGSGLQVALVGNDYTKLGDAAAKLVRAMEDTGRFENVRLNYEANQAQLSVTIDRERASDLGVDIGGLSWALQAMLDGSSVVDIFVEGEAYPVKLLSSTEPLNDPTDLQNIFVKAGDGRIVPMSSIATVEEKAVAPQLSRESQLRAVSLSAGLKSDLALGEALSMVEEMAEPLLPPGSRVMPLAEAATLDENANGLFVTFGFALVIIFLVLAAQFESFVSGLIIMSTVPLGLACAVFAMIVTGNTLNIYSQIGLVMLVGIMAKNGILIVEFANQLRDRGQDVRSAIENAANIRLRPVMMTMIATVVGAVPLVLASGAGAEARIALGWVLVGGLGLAVVVTLYLTPVAYLVIARFTKPHADEERKLQEEMNAAEVLKI
ncbi:acriflavin resistance protein [Sinorhizobium meliloti CCNWSX0020]|uniref:Acriflavin resistance protein n=2 Tax=Sinorhizobium TaxID=28105 RepID=H0G8A4_RHIML|nr:MULTISPECIES: efflux RND transporter permease subunit [Sinorhizobium]EHK74487.1 acriflavin resistance protein [Sinorhizobium meliloti CCNWSX0020]RVE87314.1 efflux RND transporter permease subunit [Sinorhizobium meliloti]RVH28269.1 efflux RND transporter permease subunit [Sinorhizobium meliloti]WHS94733.1 efflux RND transporter permease subunit [Sinorhizobium kummerowiae]WRW46679.1 efflux RND transporter permease subunit [Sinorhizobium kummerowiae]